MDGFIFEVWGHSMGFMTGPGDRAKVAPVPPERLGFGDLIVFLSAWEGGADQPKRLAIHRLLWKARSEDGWRLWTKPDMHWRVNHPIAGSCVVGKVVALERNGVWHDLESPIRHWRHTLLGLLTWTYSLAHLAAHRLGRPPRVASTRPRSSR